METLPEEPPEARPIGINAQHRHYVPWQLGLDWQRSSFPLCIYGGFVGPHSVYVGSGHFLSRCKYHRLRLRAGTHNTRFQAAADRYGLRHIHFEVLQYVPNGASKVAIEEQEYLVQASFRDDGWNILNVLQPPTEPGKRFRIGDGGKWAWATSPG